MNFYHRLEKRRQAMLDMPQMIQTWKEVSHPKLINIDTWLIITCSEDMVVDGRSGPNKWCYYELSTLLQTWRLESLCINVTWEVFRIKFGVRNMPLQGWLYECNCQGTRDLYKSLKRSKMSSFWCISEVH